MEKSTISPALTKIESRIKELKELDEAIDRIDFEITQARIHMDALAIDKDEASTTRVFLSARISKLIEDAIENEGFTTDYVYRFLKEHGYPIK